MKKDGLNRIPEYFYAKTQSLLRDGEASGAADSSTTIGSAREFLTSNYFREILPDGIYIGSGEIIDSKGNRSGQQDLIIYRNEVPKIDLGGEALFYAEGVAASIEVKSKLDQQKYHRGLTQLQKVRPLNRELGNLTIQNDYVKEQWVEKIPIFLFSFNGFDDEALRDAGENWKQENDISDDEWIELYRPEGICILSQPLAYIDARNPLIPENDSNILENNDNGLPLFLFTMALSLAITSVINIDVNWYKYMNNMMTKFGVEK